MYKRYIAECVVSVNESVCFTAVIADADNAIVFVITVMHRAAVAVAHAFQSAVVCACTVGVFCNVDVGERAKRRVQFVGVQTVHVVPLVIVDIVSKVVVLNGDHSVVEIGIVCHHSFWLNQPERLFLQTRNRRFDLLSAHPWRCSCIP